MLVLTVYLFGLCHLDTINLTEIYNRNWDHEFTLAPVYSTKMEPGFDQMLVSSAISLVCLSIFCQPMLGQGARCVMWGRVYTSRTKEKGKKHAA